MNIKFPMSCQKYYNTFIHRLALLRHQFTLYIEHEEPDFPVFQPAKTTFPTLIALSWGDHNSFVANFILAFFFTKIH